MTNTKTTAPEAETKNQDVRTPAEKARAKADEMKAKVDKAMPTIEGKAEETTSEVQVVESAIEPAKEVNGQLIMTPKHVELIKTQIAKNATPEEFDLFLMMVRRTRLDPLLKQLYFFKYKNRKASEQNGCRCYGECTCGKAVYNPATYVTSIDGLRIIAHRTGMFDGVDEPEYKYIDQRLYSCTVKVYKKGSAHHFAATVKFGEYTSGKDLWTKMPETMIAKVAEAHALRKAFPQDLSGIYTTDEMDQAKPAIETPKKVEVKRWSKEQIEELKFLMQTKGKSKEEVRFAFKKYFNIDDVRTQGVTFVQANTLLAKMRALPDITNEPDDIFSTEEIDESQQVDIDEVSDGIDAMHAEEGK